MADLAGGSVVWNLDVDDKRFTTGLAKASAEAGAFGKGLQSVGVKNWASEASTAFGNVAGAIARVARGAVVLGVGGALGVGTFIKSAAGLEQTSKSFEVLTGNAEVAHKLFAQLAQFAAKTPFEFPTIAKAGQTLLGFGIASDQVFDRVKLLGDIAAATGADFGSLAVVFGQVNATGRLMGQDALQLINNNIPITSILAKKLGVSVQEVKKRMEEGAIGVDVFNQALLETTQEGGFAFQGTEILAQSLNGRLSTLKDTVLEFGRNLLGVKVDPELGLVIKPGGVFDRFSKAVPELTKKLEELGPKFAAAFEWIVAHGEDIKGIIAAIVAAFVAAKIGSAVTAIANFGVAFSVLTGILPAATAAQWGFNAAAAANPVGLIVTAIVAVIAALVFLQVRFGIFTKAWDAIKKAWSATVGFFQKHAELFKKIFIGLAAVVFLPLILAVAPLIAAFLLIKKNWDTISGALVTSFNFVKGVVVGTFNAIVAALQFAWGIISPILDVIKNIFIIVFGIIAIVVLTALTIIKNIVVTVFTAVWNVISTVVGWIWDRLVVAFNFYKDLIVTTFTAVWNFISGIWNAIYGVISGIVQRLIDFFAPAFSWLYEKGKAIVNGLVNGIKDVAGNVWNAIKSVADQIGKFFEGAWNWLYDTGKSIVEGLVRGLKAGVQWVADTAGDIANTVKDKFKNLLGIHSPSTVFRSFGQNIVQGLAKGIDGSQGLIKAAVTGLSGELTAPNSLVFAGDVTSGGFNEQTPPAAPVINVTADFSGIVARSRSEWRDIMKDGLEAVNEELRSRNLPQLGDGKIIGASTNG